MGLFCRDVQALSDGLQGGVHLVQPGMVPHVEHPVDLWQMPAGTPGQFGFSDPLGFHPW